VNRNFFASAFAVLAGFVFGSGCTKIDTTDIGNDLIPAVDNVHTFEAVLDVITDNLLPADSTGVAYTEPHALGVIENDPEFGRTAASLYFSPSISAAGVHPFVNRDSVEIDSVVLALPFHSLYGDSNSIQQFEVFQIDPAAEFRDDTFYLLNASPIPVLPTPIGQKLVDFKTLNDSVFYVNYTSTAATITDSVRTVNQLRIPLETSFAQQFIDFDTAVEYKTDSAFRSHFKGVAVRVNEGTSPNKSALAYFSIYGERSAQIIFYARVTRNGQEDTIAPAFTYQMMRASANLVQRTPANGYLTALNNGTPSDPLLYIQSTPGSVATVKIPGLDTFSNCIIHRAELIAEKISSAQEEFYTPPPILFIDNVNEAGDSTFTLRNDFVPTNSGTGYDLSLLEGIFRNNRYTFNLSRHVQSIVTSKLPNRTFRIYAPYVVRPYYELGNGTVTEFPVNYYITVSETIATGRVVLGGGTHPTQKMRLRIIYSKI